MKSLKIFVMLPRHLDVPTWKESFAKGNVPDYTPYGYHFAEETGANVSFSVPTSTPSGLIGFVDRTIKYLLGFDIRHAWRNRSSLFGQQFDIVWTHTEYEHLAIAFLNIFTKTRNTPIIAQSIWLVDEWKKFWIWKKWLYRNLLRRSAIATFHSPANKAVASNLELSKSTALVLFGISLDSFPIKKPGTRYQPGRDIHILALGSDRHRDWYSLFEAVGAQEGFQLRVGSAFWPSSLKAKNVEVSLMTQNQIRQAYDWADFVVVPLKENLHASGITAILEAVAWGVPVVATRTGGLEAYFDSSALMYVEPGDPASLKNAITVLANDALAAVEQAHIAQNQLIEKDLTTRGFALRHVRLSHQIVGKN